MGHGVTQLLNIIQVAKQNLVVYSRSELARSEEMHRVQVGYVHPSGVRRGTLRSILLHVHAEEAHVCAVNLFECEQRFGSVRKLVWQLTWVDKSEIQNIQVMAIRGKSRVHYLDFIPGFTSTILSELETTLIATSPAPASFFLRKLFTLVSI